MTTRSTAHLDLQEALASKPTPFDEDGNVMIHVIRPCVGLGKGQHAYDAKMLQENAHVFTGWRMYVDHESPEAKRARGHLPRSIQGLGGRIIESKWDPTVPADDRYGAGAVVAKVRPVGEVKKLIEDDPELLEASIRAKATNVAPEIRDGKEVWVVEGIRRDPPGSVDWVSEGGAGGRVADLIEGLARDIEEAESNAEGGNELSELTEALADPNSEVSQSIKELAAAQASELVEAKLQEATEQHQEDLEEARNEAREEGKAEAKAEVEAERKRDGDLKAMKEKADELIEAAELPEAYVKRFKGRYDLEEGKPTPALDVEDVKDSDGKVTKPAIDLLKEKVETDIQEARDVLAELNPARVKGQGASAVEEGAKPAKTEGKSGGFHREWLEESTSLKADEVWNLGATTEEDTDKEKV